MKTRVLIIGLLGLFIVVAVARTYADDEGYYFSWYPSCTSGACNPAYSHWTEGTGLSECACCPDGGFSDCWNPMGDQVCMRTWKLFGGCSNKKVVGTTNGIVCDSSDLH